jgi:hypothetical protein
MEHLLKSDVNHDDHDNDDDDDLNEGGNSENKG